jgi:hypothetical protein
MLTVFLLVKTVILKFRQGEKPMKKAECPSAAKYRIKKDKWQILTVLKVAV